MPRAVDAVRAAGHHDLLARFAAELHAAPHALYEVRRILRPRTNDPAKLANASRSVRTLATGSRTAMLEALSAHASASSAALVRGEDGIERGYLRCRGAELPAVEHFLVAGPAGCWTSRPPGSRSGG